ncbi:PIP5K6, partial [Symbiodinium sp. KB8]
EIRSLSGIRASAFVQSLGSRKRERFTEGASGAFLYFSGDGRFIVKTLSEADKHALLRLLPAYLAYLRTHPASRIVRFLGCHSVHAHGRTVAFVVMTNVLRMPAESTPSVVHRFDLKGSWIGRSDWAGPPQMKPAEAAELREALTADVRFLESQGIMDYSLLLGTRHAASEADGGSDAASFSLGIVDVLQRWDTGKALEHAAKVYLTCRSSAGISAVPPAPYAARFLDRV